MAKIASCQIAFTPIKSDNYIGDVDKVLNIVEQSGLEYNVDILSTTIRGERDRIFTLISDIYYTMDDICSFTIDIKISNICGCN
ncbi:YkoF family thiamine/hydroxymethylpyrimidine-binding protein [Clostridiisalibacter paucivorans]|uniref:YkoF family thiamine/hydroxymethylpyrimidine-binding protein n=1 Tax=Clostridiisalibacter paucivorans TaxID=408753 RepID=UPI00146FA1DB|nr:YkoF family thiamine/hydroxymethylpyrimidine-binding protein [Clostridiisalibacter paucivorans]